MISCLQADDQRKVSALDLAAKLPENLKTAVLTVQGVATLGVAMAAPKLFQVEQSLGRPLLMKLTCAVIKFLDYSVNTKNELTAIQVFECAQLFVGKFRTDSIQDLVLCLKLLKQGDLKNEKGEILRIYNRIDSATFGEWMWSYLDWKTNQLEMLRRQEASAAIQATNNTLTEILTLMPPELRGSVATLTKKRDVVAELLDPKTSPVASDKVFSERLIEFAETIDFEDVSSITHLADMKRRAALKGDTKTLDALMVIEETYQVRLD